MPWSRDPDALGVAFADEGQRLPRAVWFREKEAAMVHLARRIATGAGQCHSFCRPNAPVCGSRRIYLPLVLVGPPALPRGLTPLQSPTRLISGQCPDEPMSLTLRLTKFPRSTCWNWGRGCDQARKRSKQAPAAAVRVKGPALPQGACLDRPRQLALHARGLGMRFSPGRKIWCDLMRRRTLQGKADSRERSADSHSLRA